MTRITCAPQHYDFTTGSSSDLEIVLYGHRQPGRGAVGGSVLRKIQSRGLKPAPKVWDLLSIALSIAATDLGVRRDNSPDGWTRQLDLRIGVSDPSFWSSQGDLLNRMLRFLTTDIWNLSFFESHLQLQEISPLDFPEQDSVVLLSGGLDSLVGALDLVKAKGINPYAVSQVSLGDRRKQIRFAASIGNGLAHLQLNHNANCPGNNELSQRARSVVFLAYGTLVATALKKYQAGSPVTLYVCENGFISINPPLTVSRLGGLSTRTTHPYFLEMYQQLLMNADLQVTLENPYQFLTKGEMLWHCSDQATLRRFAHESTSCGRYARNGFTHCGRCLPCLIRRAAFHRWEVEDRTRYIYVDLSRDDENHKRYDDVLSSAMAITSASEQGVLTWAGPALSSVLLGDITSYSEAVSRGLAELSAFLTEAGVL